MAVKTLRKNGRDYIVIPRAEYDGLVARARQTKLPPLPAANADGNYPAMEYLRASIARDIIRDREAVGLSQAELARRAGIRIETLCRIETGKHTASVPTIDKIDRVLRQLTNKRKGR